MPSGASKKTTGGVNHSPSPTKPSSRSSSLAYLLLGFLALCGVGYNVGTLIDQESPRGLVVDGPDRVEIEHPDRAEPAEAVFKLRNPTSRPIRIEEVVNDCRCTTNFSSGRTVEPGQVVSLVVRVEAFDTYRDDFAQRTLVNTSDGQVELRVTGTLPMNPEVLYFPHALHLEPDDEGAWPGRLIRLRVPGGCAPDRPRIEVRTSPADFISADVSEGPPSGRYRQFVIRVDPGPAAGLAPEGGRIIVETGCDSLEIPVRFAGRVERSG